MNKNLGIIWLREDFRLQRNHALSFATNNHEKVTALYIFKKNDFKKKREAQLWWTYKSLKNFEKELNKKNINLEFKVADTYEEVFKSILLKKNFSIYWNKVYKPNFLKYDDKLSKDLKKNIINFKIFKGNILNEVDAVKKGDGTPYKVFTPFWKMAESIYLNQSFSKNLSIKTLKNKATFLKDKNKIEDILPSKNWYKKFEKYWNPSEKEALKVCDDFIKNKIFNYGDLRDIPGVEGTSKISSYLSSGLIHVETIWEKCDLIKEKKKGYRKFINELGWREFSHSLINYFPEMLSQNLRKEFDNFPWVKNDDHFNTWKKGMTGYPIVDAGMRELHETGWMHNRVRMITASFLVKHLRINWKEGEKYFRNSLLDFNEANNVAGWQWVSGCGADAAPYFRIFNPILQGEKFDKEGTYVKKWIPELSKFPKEYIHKPWELNNNFNDFKLGKNYPPPIVDHKAARESALDAFKKIKNKNKK
jgi:deoxyribodipyrimidine photo-lyase